MNGEALMECDKGGTFKEKNKCKETESKNEKKASEIICIHNEEGNQCQNYAMWQLLEN